MAQSTTFKLLLVLLSSLNLALAIPTSNRGQHEASSPAHDRCRGAWDLCCSMKAHSHNYGPFPLVSPSNPTGLLSQTTELFKPILNIAADTLCNTASGRPRPAASKTCAATSTWSGFENIQYIFSFGDSYTTTEFRWQDTPVPSLPDLPLGNPQEPRPPLHTSSNGPNWIEFLTVKYNRSELLTYNIAKGGATVALPPGQPDTQYGLPGQVEDVFIPGYASGTDSSAPAPRPDWNSRNTLFAIWLGINDVNGSFSMGRGVTEALNKQIIRLYAKELEKLFEYGVMNIVLLNVPALERSPWILAHGKDAVAMMAEDLKQFNTLIAEMAADFKAKHEGVNVWVYDSYRDFTAAIDEPKYFEQTKNIKIVSAYCDSYWP